MSVAVLESSVLDEQIRAELGTLWESAFGADFTDHDAEHAFGGVHVVVREGPRVVSHACAVPRPIVVGDQTVDAGYVEAVATRPAHQGRGLGSHVMRELDGLLRVRFEMGVLSTSRRAFYARLGWEAWQGPSYVIRDGTRRRTEDEDDGLMVLRFGVSAEIDLSSPIACYDRPGDAW